MKTPDPVKRLIGILESVGLSDRLAAARLLCLRLSEPESLVTLVGETSSGKTTLINSLVGRALLPVAAHPTTGAVTEVILVSSGPESYGAVYRDASRADLSLQEFLALNLEPSKELLRLTVRVPQESVEPAEMHIVDTPGYNSLILDHDEVLKEFIPQSDVVVFVVGYRTGFGEPDQELLEVVRAAVGDSRTTPVLLVLNRAPGGVTLGDRRVREIIANARDCLRRDPEMILVRTSSENIALMEGMESGTAVLPDASPLWDSVAKIVADPEQRRRVKQKIIIALRDLADDSDRALERRKITIRADESELGEISRNIDYLEAARKESLDLIAETFTRLSRQIPANVNRLAAEVVSRMNRVIDDSDKWLECEFCLSYLTAHELPFEVRQAARSIQDLLLMELEDLDRKLSDIANTAVHNIREGREPRIRSDAADRLAKNLARMMIERLGGAGINSLLRSLGGVGGTAAGAGNLVKMLVKRTGKIFNKTFSREVYTKIGKIFTKRLMAKLNVAIMVLIETACYLREVHTWQRKLKKKVSEAIDGWKSEVLEDLLGSYFPEISNASETSVRSIYDPMLVGLRDDIEKRGGNISREVNRLERIQRELRDVYEALDLSIGKEVKDER